MRKKILFAFDDPGGGLAVSSVMNALRYDDDFELVIYAGLLSQKFLEEQKINFKDLKSIISREEAGKIIDKESPEIIVTGTSGGDAEQEIRNVAFEKKIRSIVILDFWKDYARRWFYASYPVKEMQDEVCVMDELTKSEMIAEGFPKRYLVVTGHPYLDRLFSTSEVHSPDFASTNDPQNFLFLSQPLHVLGIKEYEVHPFNTLLNVLRKISDAKREKIFLTVKLHPSEDLSEEIVDLMSIYNSDNFEIKFANELKSLHELFKLNDAVIGYNSIAMFEAKASGLRTISMGIAPVKKSLLAAMEKAGIEIAEANENKLFDCVINKKNLEMSRDHFKGGISNCINLIKGVN